MVGSTNSDRLDRGRFLIGLAMTCLAGGLPLLGVPVPPLLGVLMVVSGCAMVLWWSWDKSSHYHVAARLLALGAILLIFGYTGWRMYLRRSDPPVPQPTKSPEAVLPGKNSPVPVQRGRVVLHEFKVFFQSGANDPEFFIDNQPARPTQYSSGIATFRLATGTYEIRAKYPTVICSVEVSVPSSSPAAATCNLR